MITGNFEPRKLEFMPQGNLETKVHKKLVFMHLHFGYLGAMVKLCRKMLQNRPYNFPSKTILIASILVLVLSVAAFSQEESNALFSEQRFDTNATGRLSFSFDNLSFFKNNEYKSNYADGYTLAGTWIRPKLIYYPDKKLRLELGGQVLAYNGRDEYQLHPWFSVLFNPVKNLLFRMGNLDQDHIHGLPEPIMDRERFFREKPEAGIQLKYDHAKVSTDLWIDWQRVILKGDPYKERFVFGTVSKFLLFQNDKKKLSLPVVFNGLHEGGEIDNAGGLAQTHIVVSEGLRYEYKTDGNLIKAGRLDCSFLQSTYPLHETALPGKNGIGLFIQTTSCTDYGYFSTAYWQGNQFFTPLGMPLFQNGAIGENEASKINRLWVFSYRYDCKIFDQSKFGFTSDLFYNPVTNKLSNSAALFVKVNLSVFITKKAN